MTNDEKRLILLEWLAWFVASEYITEFWAQSTLKTTLTKLNDLK